MAGVTVEEVQVLVTAEVDKALKDLEKVDKKPDAISANFIKMAKTLAGPAVLGLIISYGKKVEKAFQVQEAAEAKLNQTLIATQYAAGLTAEELTKMASSLQGVTKYGDEAIIGAESLLLTFKDIGSDVFPRALESILDVSEAMGQDLQSSTIQLGKALNDPVAGLSALTRVGIQFTDEQENLIKSFVEAGDKASAQRVILKELESQFGGVARAAALTSEGISVQLNNAYGDLQETIGSVISNALTPYRSELTKEIVKINETITAHILRQKVIRGEATLVEILTSKQNELKKKNEEIAQATLNINNAENQVYDTRYLSEQQINRIESAKAASIKQAQELVLQLQREKDAIERQIGAITRQVEEEKAALDANIGLAQGLKALEEEEEKTAEATQELNDTLEETADDAETATLALQTLGREAFFSMNQALEALEQYDEQLKEAKISAEDLAKVGLSSLASGFSEIGEAIAAGNLQFKDFGKLALNVLADVLQSLGAQLAAQAALLFFGLIPDIGRGTGALAASAAAFTASGIARGLAGAMPEGGTFVTNGPTPLLVGDNPGGQEEVTVRPVSSNGANVGSVGMPEKLTLMIDGTQFTAYVQGLVDNRRLRSSRGGAL